MKYFLFGLLITFLALSCYPKKKNVPLKELNKRIELFRSTCLGQCPVFTLTIYENGKISYNGMLNVEKIGLWVRQLPKEEFEDVLNIFEAANLWQYDDNYKSDIVDLPKTNLKYFKDGKMKKIVGDINLPDSVKALAGLLDKIAEQDGWTLIDKDGNKLPPPTPKPEEKIDNEVIVKFKPSTDIADWVHKYEQYDMLLIRAIVPSDRSIWLLSYDTEKIKSDEMMSILKADKELHSVEFNKKLNMRHR